MPSGYPPDLRWRDTWRSGDCEPDANLTAPIEQWRTDYRKFTVRAAASCSITTLPIPALPL